MGHHSTPPPVSRSPTVLPSPCHDNPVKTAAGWRRVFFPFNAILFFPEQPADLPPLENVKNKRKGKGFLMAKTDYGMLKPWFLFYCTSKQTAMQLYVLMP